MQTTSNTTLKTNTLPLYNRPIAARIIFNIKANQAEKIDIAEAKATPIATFILSQ